MDPERPRNYRPLIVAGCILAIIVAAVNIASWSRGRAEEAEYNALLTEYLNPDFSPEFCAYWQIDNLQDYKTALRQQLKQASFEAMEQAYGETEAEVLHFRRLRVVNWLELQMIERAEYRLQFDRRGDAKVGPHSLNIMPLSDKELRARVPY